MYHVGCEPLRIFWNNDTTCSTRVPRVLPTTGWKARNPVRSRQHAWHSCWAGCSVISENPQGLAAHLVENKRYLGRPITWPFITDNPHILCIILVHSLFVKRSQSKQGRNFICQEFPNARKLWFLIPGYKTSTCVSVQFLVRNKSMNTPAFSSFYVIVLSRYKRTRSLLKT